VCVIIREGRRQKGGREVSKKEGELLNSAGRIGVFFLFVLVIFPVQGRKLVRVAWNPKAAVDTHLHPFSPFRRFHARHRLVERGDILLVEGIPHWRRELLENL
jgi:hypothetical protein